MKKSMIIFALASAAALVACGASSQPAQPAPEQAIFTDLGGDTGCGLYEVTHKGRTFYMATRRGAGSCALMDGPAPVESPA